MSDYDYNDYNEAEFYIGTFAGAFVCIIGIILIVIIICCKRHQQRGMTTVQPASTNVTTVHHSTGDDHLILDKN
jgi:hypothetical protein